MAIVLIKSLNSCLYIVLDHISDSCSIVPVADLSKFLASVSLQLSATFCLPRYNSRMRHGTDFKQTCTRSVTFCCALRVSKIYCHHPKRVNNQVSGSDFSIFSINSRPTPREVDHSINFPYQLSTRPKSSAYCLSK